jgi:hypothetical protein
MFKPSRCSHLCAIISVSILLSTSSDLQFDSFQASQSSETGKRLPIPVDFSFSFSSMPGLNPKRPKLFNNMPTAQVSAQEESCLERSYQLAGFFLPILLAVVLTPNSIGSRQKAWDISSSKLSNGRNPNRSGRSAQSECPL